MAQYKVLERSWINNRLVEPGEVIEYAGRAGSNLEPLDKKSKKTEATSASSSPDDSDSSPL